MTNIELHGHGDPILVVAMKETQLEEVKSENDVVAKVSHEATGHGDPLFQSVLEHDNPGMNPLHAKFNDPLMEAFIEEWHTAKGDTHATEEKAESETQVEMKHQGDPLLMETIAQDPKTFGAKT